jgi:hypothetical protein
MAPGRIDSLANLGLKWIVVAKTAFGEPLPSNNLPIIQRFENEHYQIYSLGKYP